MKKQVKSVSLVFSSFVSWIIGTASLAQAYGNYSDPAAAGAPGLHGTQVQHMNNTHQYPYRARYYPHKTMMSTPYGPSFGNQLNPSFMPKAITGKHKGFASYGQLAKPPANVPVNNINGVNLPPTSLDSFVREAGGRASNIYGDEGTSYIPPLNGYSERNTINAGILGENNLAITTGHGSLLPNASGTGYSISGPRELYVRQRRELPRHDGLGFQTVEGLNSGSGQ